jgi:putative transposase
LLQLLRLFLISHAALIAENLFLRKQLAMFKEREQRPRPASRATRLAMIALARFFDWRSALVVVKPETFIEWHRNAFRIFWRWKFGKKGRPALPQNLLDRSALLGVPWRVEAESDALTAIRRAERYVGSRSWA